MTARDRESAGKESERGMKNGEQGNGEQGNEESIPAPAEETASARSGFESATLPIT